jgi:hypothetical protein
VKKFNQCLEEARALLRDAADVWALGDAENPPTLDVLLNILQAFAKEGFLFFPSDAPVEIPLFSQTASSTKSAG